MKFTKTFLFASLFITSSLTYALSPFTRLNNPNDSDTRNYSCEQLEQNQCATLIITSTRTLQCVNNHAVAMCELYRDRYWPQIKTLWQRGEYIDNLTGQTDPYQHLLPAQQRGPRSSHCSAFVHYLLDDLGYAIPPFNSELPSDFVGLANTQAQFFAESNEWIELPTMWDAQLSANQGKIVIASVLDQSYHGASGHIGIILPNIYNNLKDMYFRGGPVAMMVGYHSYRVKDLVSGFFVHLRNYQANEAQATPDIILINQIVKYYTPRKSIPLW